MSDCTNRSKIVEVELRLPKRGEWRAAHLANCKTLDRELALKAVAFLRVFLGPHNIKFVQDQGALNDEWWVPFHHGTMMAVRNQLREHGFGEKEFDIDNLDDYAVGLMELAADLTTLNEVQVIRCSKCSKTFGDEGVLVITSLTRILNGGAESGEPERECNICADMRKVANMPPKNEPKMCSCGDHDDHGNQYIDGKRVN